MGHIRLGRLPKTRPWRHVIGLLKEAPRDSAGLASAVATAAEEQLGAFGSDQSVTYCFWLLTRIALASRSENFAAELAELGLHAGSTTSTVAFISQVADQARGELATNTSSGHLTEIASLALRRTLTETIGQHGPSLFGSSLDDLQQAFRQHSTQRQFATLSKQFFGDFLARVLRVAINRELSQHVGQGHEIANVATAAKFTQALDTYARQSARIVEDFAGGWYSKRNWETKGEISQQDARRFVAVAFRKLRMELQLGTVTQ